MFLRRLSEIGEGYSRADLLGEIDGETRGQPSEEARGGSSRSDDGDESSEVGLRWSEDGTPVYGQC